MLQAWRFFSTVLKIIFRHPVLGTTIVPILPDGKIVLVRRRDTGQWSLPGGIVDWGEDVPNTVKRELKEETGLDLIKIERLVGIYSSPDRDPRLHSISILISVHVEGQIKIQDTLELSEAQAFTLNDLPLGELAHDHDLQIQDYLNGTTTIA